METLCELVEAWDADPEVRAIVIAGSDEYFAAGADIKAMRDRTFQEALVNSMTSFWPRLAAGKTPLIAAVAGYALGGGRELALICDMIVASETAEVGRAEIMLGIIPGGGGTQRLARVVGKQRAMELVLTGRRIDAQDGFRLGIVNRVAKKKEWLDDALELADVVARRPALAVRLGKQAVLAADETTLQAGVGPERRPYELSMGTQDRTQGMSAVIEKRRPRLKGRGRSHPRGAAAWGAARMGP